MKPFPMEMWWGALVWVLVGLLVVVVSYRRIRNMAEATWSFRAEDYFLMVAFWPYTIWMFWKNHDHSR